MDAQQDTGFTGTLSRWWTKTKDAVSSTVQPVVDTAVSTTGTAPIATTDGAQKALGTAPEAPGTTMAGGRRKKRHHKTRRNKKTKKTMKRKH